MNIEHEVGLVDELIESSLDSRREFVKEELALEATELVSELMERENVSKSDLAKRIGKSKALVTQLLAGDRNMTVHTLAGLAFALGYRVQLRPVPLWKQRVYEVDHQYTIDPAALTIPPYAMNGPAQLAVRTGSEKDPARELVA